MNEFKNWISLLKENGLLCDVYCEKVDNANSKLALVRCCLDANGINFLQEMQAKGMGLAYETILTEFKSYINGRYIAEFKNEKSNGYTSSIFCCYFESDTIEVTTTLISLLGCKSKVKIANNDFVRIYADKNCELDIICPSSSRCIVEYWHGAKISVIDNNDKVELIER